MTHIVTDNCIKCKYTDCVEVCPVDCFYEGENMLVIDPEECIDCGVCIPECPIDAIKTDSDMSVDVAKWVSINATYAKKWSNITKMNSLSEDFKSEAKLFEDVDNKFENYFYENLGNIEEVEEFFKQNEQCAMELAGDKREELMEGLMSKFNVSKEDIESLIKNI